MVAQTTEEYCSCLYEHALEALAIGRLPTTLTQRVLGARGSGHVCTLCGDPISSGEAEVALRGFGEAGGAVAARLHFGCYRLWQLVCQGRRRGSH